MSFLSGHRDPDVIVISDDEPAVGSQARGPAEIVWKNGLQIKLPQVAKEDVTDTLEFVSVVLLYNIIYR
jgi:hypothetical protein